MVAGGGRRAAQTSLVELWLKEFTDKIKYALYAADSDGGHSDLGQQFEPGPESQPWPAAGRGLWLIPAVFRSGRRFLVFP